MGYSRKTINRGGGEAWGYSFLNSPQPSLLSLYTWKFLRKEAFTPGNSVKLYDTLWKFHGQKNQDSWKFPMIFFLNDPWKFHFLYNWPLKFPHTFSSIPAEIPCPHPTYLGFSGIAQIPHSISKKKASRIGQIKIPYNFERLAI